MDIENAFSKEEQEKLMKTVQQILDKTLVFSDYCQNIRDKVTSKERVNRSAGLNQLSFVILNLPKDFLDHEEAMYLLKFLSARFDDCGHSAELLVRVVHHLYFTVQRFEKADIFEVFHNIFAENGVQAYAQADRALFLEIMDHTVDHYFYVIEELGVQYYNIFSNTAGGERDPRCLMKVFSIFSKVMRQMDVGPFMEDMFDLIACYYPIEYQPRETDKNPLSPEALSAGCEACLIANRGFSLYTYQLILDKLMEDDENVGHETKLKICKFLISVMTKFGPGSLLALTDEFLAAFRMISFNPRRKSFEKETVDTVGSTMKALINCLNQLDSPRSEEEIERATHQMIENSEPFVLQAEMGLAAKALKTFEFVVLAHEIAAELALPKVLYWLRALIAGITIKNIENKKEILEETLPLTPEWLEIGIKTGKGNHVQEAVPGLIGALKNIEDVDSQLLQQVLAEIGRILVGNEDLRANLKKEIEDVLDKVLAVEYHDSEKLRTAIASFLEEYVQHDFETVWNKVEKDLKAVDYWSAKEFLFCGALVSSEVGLERCYPLFLERMTNKDSDVKLSIIEFGVILEKNKERDLVDERLISPFCKALGQLLDQFKDDRQRLVDLGERLQDLVLKVDKRLKPNLLNWFQSTIFEVLKSSELSAKQTIGALEFLLPVVLQTTDASTLTNLLQNLYEYHKNHTDENISNYLLAVLFAVHNRGAADHEVVRSIVNDDSLSAEAEAVILRNEVLTKRIFPVEKVRKMLNGADPKQLYQVLNFDSTLTDPVKNNFSKTFIWTQRILTQFIPIFVEEYKGSEDKGKMNAMAKMIPSILQLSQRVSIPMTHELMILFPLLIASINETEVTSSEFSLLIKSIVNLLKLTNKQDLAIDRLSEVAYEFEKVLVDPNSPSSAVFSALEGLEAVGKRVQSASRFFRWDQTIISIRKATQSKKRIIRQKAAYVSNLWEVMPV
ncbi:unnamed protein product [Bursaphelenchus xylophilus]|uniref:MMS19 nucleotide excision repair protein n=1 Tax=Bursaphelenchus xylophilus TaxID=6326 RepID=A0A1I7RNK2_BURXY|nr:unnamed protein product [Bursaphelenchus xylophilus]CAG9124108.1 unnamed protein product [Bursaphelenchus xylophilus]